MVRGMWGGGVLAAAAAAIVATGCGSAVPSAATSPVPASTLTGALTVLAAASLTEPFDDVRAGLEKEHPGLHITYGFAGSQTLVTQVINGAPADVIATADQATMQRLVDASLVDTPTVLAHNRLEIAVAPGNPRGIRTLAGLAGAGLAVVLADPSVPAGRFAAQALRRAGVTVTPRSLELDVRSVLRRVASGEADAGIVYVTDVIAAGGSVTGVEIPDAQNVVATCPIAPITASRNHAAAVAFVTEVVSGDGRRALRRRGFLAP